MKTIVCYGDSNTWGFKPEPARPAIETARFAWNVRWTGILQKLLGSGFRVEEEGLSGRTTAFNDLFDERLNGLRYLDCCLLTKMPVDLAILMLGTNDTKEYFGVDAYHISCGLEQLILKIKQGGYGPSGKCPEILIVSPANLRENIYSTWTGEVFGKGCLKKDMSLKKYYQQVADRNSCRFIDAANFVEASAVDAVHLDAKNHDKLARVIYKETMKIFD